MKVRAVGAWLCFPALVLAAGDKPPAEVEVARPVSREVRPYEEFTGRIEPSASVEVKARVTGYLSRVAFRDGAEVKQGDLLFELDPALYKLEVEKAEAELAVAAARLKRAEAGHKRATALLEGKAISREEADRRADDLEEARARYQLAKALRTKAAVFLDGTRVRAPFKGRVSARRLDVGGVALADQTTLATLVAVGSVHVYFDVDERTLLRWLRGKDKDPEVAVGLADEGGCPRRGTVDYAEARLDPRTEMCRMRALVPNTDGLLRPGLFARVRLATGKSYKALLVPTSALHVEASQPRVVPSDLYVVNASNQLERRDVRLGQHHGGLVVVKEGLKAGDRVVTAAPGRLTLGTKVRVKEGAPRGTK